MIASLDRVFSLARVRYRIVQGLSYLHARDMSESDMRLREILRPSEFALVIRLSPADRAHHLDVYDRLLRSGCLDRDLLTAALLHDVGKVDGDARVGLVHRTVAVLLAAVSRPLLRSLSSPSGARWRRSLYLARAHPAIGSRYAREIGCSETVCWLIAHHHDRNASDERIVQLQRADDGMNA